MTDDKVYTGVGSRQPTEPVFSQIKEIATLLDRRGFTLRSGGADGCDTEFEKWSKKKEIYLATGKIPDLAFGIAAGYHAYWKFLTPYAKKLHARNVQQVLGQDLDKPTRFVICWTKDGCEYHNRRTRETGGTGTAISVASMRGIKVYNLKNYEGKIMYEMLIDELREL